MMFYFYTNFFLLMMHIFKIFISNDQIILVAQIIGC